MCAEECKLNVMEPFIYKFYAPPGFQFTSFHFESDLDYCSIYSQKKSDILATIGLKFEIRLFFFV